MRRKSKIDTHIELVYARYCSGVQINVMDIGKVFAEAHRLLDAGHKTTEDLGPRLRAFVDTLAVQP